MAVAPSASARRVAAVLTFLARTAGDDVTLTELATGTAMNKTTCQSVLLALTESGFVIRDETRKSYQLGPATLALAAAPGVHQEAFAHARIEMDDLSRELDVESAATIATDAEIIKIRRVARRSMTGSSLRPGQAVPLMFPLGAVHIAWSSQNTVDRWLSRAGVDADGELHARVVAGLAAVRRRGYSMTLDDPIRQTLVDVVSLAPSIASEEFRNERDRLLAELASEDRQVHAFDQNTTVRINQIAAPVFDANQRVVLVIGLMETGESDVARIEQHSDRLLRSTRSITRSIGGRPPATAR